MSAQHRQPLQAVARLAGPVAVVVQQGAEIVALRRGVVHHQYSVLPMPPQALHQARHIAHPAHVALADVVGDVLSEQGLAALRVGRAGEDDHRDPVFLHQRHHLAVGGVGQVQVQHRHEQLSGMRRQQLAGLGQGLGEQGLQSLHGADARRQQRGDGAAVLHDEHLVPRRGRNLFCCHGVTCGSVPLHGQGMGPRFPWRPASHILERLPTPRTPQRCNETSPLPRNVVTKR